MIYCVCVCVCGGGGGGGGGHVDCNPCTDGEQYSPREGLTVAIYNQEGGFL